MPLPLKQLLQKYNKPGPRYTSYPTAPAWTDKVGSNDYKQALQSLDAGELLSLYVHLPFCEKLCHFCGCMKVITQDHAKSQEYVTILLNEIDSVVAAIPDEVRQVTQIHFGGGTPNFLKPEELAAVMTRLRDHFEVLNDTEVAIEMHPRTSTKAFCDKLKELHFNRISLGVQDFDPEVQKLINRFQSYEQTVEMLDYLRGLGFDSFNFDLIYGLPGQDMATWQDTLQKVLTLRPNRLAVYSYAHVPWVAPVQRSFQDSDLPEPELKLALFEEAYETFTQNGYRLIGMDHFALEDDELSQALQHGGIHRNFMGYSTRADAHQIGFGVSAISFVGGHYFQNKKELKDYYDSVQKGDPATFRGFLLSLDDAIRRDVITRIMCQGWVDFFPFEEKWHLDFHEYFKNELAALKPLESDGLVVCDEGGLKATEQGQLFLRNIAMVFDTYLEKIQEGAENPTFSKTV